MIKKTLIKEGKSIVIENIFTKKITMLINKRGLISVNCFINNKEYYLRKSKPSCKILLYDFCEMYFIDILSSEYYLFRYYISDEKLDIQENLSINPDFDRLFKYRLQEGILKL